MVVPFAHGVARVSDADAFHLGEQLLHRLRGK